jgi:hypothetical protein
MVYPVIGTDFAIPGLAYALTRCGAALKALSRRKKRKIELRQANL